MRRLQPCTSCDRHLRGTESHCPFCGEEVRVVSIVPPRAWRNLGRAAILGLAGVTTVACHDAGADTTDPGDTSGGEDGDGSDPSSPGDAGSDSGDEDDPGSTVSLYGTAYVE
ncbi:MAG: hypothetical protein AB7S26_26465 [Sandaracinaceae bacterium]